MDIKPVRSYSLWDGCEKKQRTTLQIPRPSEMVTTGDAKYHVIYKPSETANWNYYMTNYLSPHGQTMNLTFLDGHVESLQSTSSIFHYSAENEKKHWVQVQ